MNQTNNNKNCCGRLPNGQGWGHSGSCEDQTNNRIREEWKEDIKDVNWGGNDDNIADWWLSKIAELLKSQEHKLREEWKNKLKSIHNKCKTERGLSVALLNLIKEE